VTMVVTMVATQPHRGIARRRMSTATTLTTSHIPAEWRSWLRSILAPYECRVVEELSVGERVHGLLESALRAHERVIPSLRLDFLERRMRFVSTVQ
jgi:hypothetical protein